MDNQGKSRATPRSAARFAAVQALYQMDVAQTDLNDVITEFSIHRIKDLLEASQIENIDNGFFQSLLKGIVEEQRAIDPAINGKLATGWDLSRIDSILRAILRAGAFEMMFRKDVPAKVVINEYLNISHAFFEGQETKMVNAVLDNLAKDARPEALPN